MGKYNKKKLSSKVIAARGILIALGGFAILILLAFL